jgi:hypothetical protein
MVQLTIREKESQNEKRNKRDLKAFLSVDFRQILLKVCLESLFLFVSMLMFEFCCFRDVAFTFDCFVVFCTNYV